MNNPFLSIIIPAYNEEDRLPTCLTNIAHFVQAQAFDSEVLVADDGSEDRTAAVVQEFAAHYPFTQLISLPHRGKGHAVKCGLLAAKGDHLFMCDADLSMPIGQVLSFLPPNCSEYDVAVGSREVAGACRFDEPVHRHIMGRAFNIVVRMLAVRGVADTQAGFKCFRREAAHAILSYQTIDGWAFDVEVLHIAKKQAYQIIEVPIQWYYMDRSQVRPIRDTVSMVREVLRIRINSMCGLYDIQSEKAGVKTYEDGSFAR